MNDHTFQYTSPHKDHPQLLIPWEINNTIGRFLIAWFNECVLGKSGQIANPIIAMVDPVLYAYVYACESINYCKCRNRQDHFMWPKKAQYL